MEFDGKYVLALRVEGVDRKSFFAIAESENGIDGFRFWDYPVLMPETDVLDINVYDMRLVRHEDGWIYGLFCTERKILTPRQVIFLCGRTMWNRSHKGSAKLGTASRFKNQFTSAAQRGPTSRIC
jgi:hypothetical protein